MLNYTFVERDIHGEKTGLMVYADVVPRVGETVDMKGYPYRVEDVRHPVQGKHVLETGRIEVIVVRK